MPGINNLYRTKERELQMELTFGSTTGYHTIPGVLSDDITAGQADSEEVVTYEGTTTQTGDAPPGQVTIEALWQPLNTVFHHLHKAYTEATKHNFQFLTKGQGLLYTAGTSATIAWTGAGVVTFGGTNPSPANFDGDSFKVGDIIIDGNSTPANRKTVVIRAIDRVSDAWQVTVADLDGTPPSALSAVTGAYTISRPNIKQGPFVASVLEFGSISSEAGGNQTTSIILQPESVLPLPTIA